MCDLGGVLNDWNPRHLYRRLFDGDEAAMERFLAEVCTDESNACRPFAEAVAELTARHPAELHRLIEAYTTSAERRYRGAIDDTVAVRAELRRAGIPLYALSNWSAEKFPAMRTRFEFLAWFELILLSDEADLMKRRRSARPAVSSERTRRGSRHPLHPAAGGL